jgi:hypothetical protein
MMVCRCEDAASKARENEKGRGEQIAENLKQRYATPAMCIWNVLSSHALMLHGILDMLRLHA